jgi:site-specific DNA recombinase
MTSRHRRPDQRGAGRDGFEGRESAPRDGSPSVTRKLRCAVYTRKSTEEGLDMEFNSLDAQREACEGLYR